MESIQQKAKVININCKIPTPVPLALQVRQAVDLYFKQLNGHDVAGLYAMVTAEVEKPLIEATLEHCSHNQTKAAKILGLSRSTLRKKMDQFGIS